MNQKQGIVEVTPPGRSSFDEYLEDLMEKNIYYRAGSLSTTGFDLTEDIYDAVYKAMRIMGRGGFPLQQHFKRIYVWDEKAGAVRPDWMMSRMAMALTVLNGPAENPVVGKTQLWLLRQMMSV